MTVNLSWKVLARDVVIVWLLTNLGGAVVGFTGAALLGPDALANPRTQLALAFSNFIFGILGFTIVGALKRVGRFSYLLVVGVINWLLNGLTLVFTPLTLNISLKQWLLAPLFMLVLIAVGGGLSLLFVSAQKATNESGSN